MLFKWFLSYDNALSIGQQIIMNGYLALKYISLTPQATYGLDTSNIVVEEVPLVLATPKMLPLERITPKQTTHSHAKNM